MAVATMCYRHRIGKLFPLGRARLLAFLPAIIILLILPLRVTFILLGGPTSFFLSWLSTFKLLLLAFGKGPLSSDLPLSLPHFVTLAFLPIKFQDQPNPSNIQNNQNSRKTRKSSLNYVCAIMVFGLVVCALVSLFTRELLRVELHPQFDEPYLSTSLQDFWGRRWNLMVNRVLHPTVYDPVMNNYARVLGRRWAPLPAILSTFIVSGLMHKLIFYYIKRESTWEAWEPSWDSMFFFLLQGVSVSIEVALKKVLRGKYQLSRFLLWLLTVVFIFYTTLSLFVSAVVRCGVYDKATKELNDLVDFGKDLCGVVC